MIPGNLLLFIKTKQNYNSHMRGGNASIMDMIGSYNKSRLLFSSALHVCESVWMKTMMALMRRLIKKEVNNSTP